MKTQQDQVKGREGGGGGDVTNHSCVLIQLVSTMYQTIHNSLSGADRSGQC